MNYLLLSSYKEIKCLSYLIFFLFIPTRSLILVTRDLTIQSSTIRNSITELDRTKLNHTSSTTQSSFIQNSPTQSLAIQSSTKEYSSTIESLAIQNLTIHFFIENSTSPSSTYSAYSILVGSLLSLNI